MKFIHLITATKILPWGLTKDTALETYASVKSENLVKTLFVYASEYDKVVEDGMDLHTTLSHLDMTPRRLLVGFKHVYENYDFDFIIKTCESSYIDYKLLHLQPKYNERFYGGVRGNHSGIDFVSGASIIFSRDIIKIIIDHEHEVNNNPFVYDDVAFGDLLCKKLNIPICHLDRQIVDYHNTIIDTNQFHYRCKRSTDYSQYAANVTESFKRIYNIKHNI